ncbi:Protein TOXD 2 [Colletotrichum chlorophyti]|uniref:Protein TOXD 2 n=1 Tax=Colletotrichum chlorophyti TaxID=708187 RepID=A0A1Q8S433_9PEZI|nr:Protein TOXD 2 [Colletotrichum chlorophyti]
MESAEFILDAQALVIRAKGEARIVAQPLPCLSDDYILVRTTAVAINPTDWKHLDQVNVGHTAGCRLGFDYAGIVVALGSAVKTGTLSVGDRVYGFCHGGRKQDGTFGEYLTAKALLQRRIPSNLSDIQAASLGCNLLAVCQGLYQRLGIPLPSAERCPDISVTKSQPLLIYGGTTASGLLGIQFAKLSGCFPIVVTCSPDHNDYVYSLGANLCVDYHQRDCARQIQQFLSSKKIALELAWDCIGSAHSARVCAQVLDHNGFNMENGMKGIRHGHGPLYASLMPVPLNLLQRINGAIENAGRCFGYTAFGEEFLKDGVVVPASQEDLEYAANFMSLAQDLLAHGRIIPIRIDVNRGGSGLPGVMNGIDEARRGKVRAVKLVYTMDDCGQ